jgi:hypothetical protein
MRSVPARAICDDVETRWDAGDRKQADELVSLYMGGEIGKQSGKRHGANEDQKDPHWPPREVGFTSSAF